MTAVKRHSSHPDICAAVPVSAGSGSVSVGFGSPGTFPCFAGFPSWPPQSPAGTSGPNWK